MSKEWEGTADFREVNKMISDLLMDKGYLLGPSDHACPKCNNPLYYEKKPTGNGLTSMRVFCLDCKRSKEWIHSMWDRSYFHRAFADFKTLVDLEEDDENRETT